MFFSKEILQQESSILYDDKEVVEVLNDYYNDFLTQEAKLLEEREKAVKILKGYCNRFYKNSLISSLEEDFYNKFILMYMPSYSLILSEQEMRSVLTEAGNVLEFINNYHGIDLTRPYKKNLTSNQDEILRVFYIIRKMQKYTEAPVLSFNPMIIDMNCYKKRKRHHQDVSKREMYEQGFFEIIDKIGGIVILKKSKAKAGNSYIKIKVENSLASDMRCHDIINMRIKKRFFYTTWDIIDIKDYYSHKVSEYLE